MVSSGRLSKQCYDSYNGLLHVYPVLVLYIFIYLFLFYAGVGLCPKTVHSVGNPVRPIFPVEDSSETFCL